MSPYGSGILANQAELFINGITRTDASRGLLSIVSICGTARGYYLSICGAARQWEML